MDMNDAQKEAWLEARTYRVDNGFYTDPARQVNFVSGQFVGEPQQRRRFLGIPLGRQPNPDYFLTQRDIDIQRNLVQAGRNLNRSLDDLDPLSDLHLAYTRYGHIRDDFEQQRAGLEYILEDAILRNASLLLRRRDVQQYLSPDDRREIGDYIIRQQGRILSRENVEQFDNQIAAMEVILRNPQASTRDPGEVRDSLLNIVRRDARQTEQRAAQATQRAAQAARRAAQNAGRILVDWRVAVILVAVAGVSLMQIPNFKSDVKEAARNVRYAVENMFGTEDVSQENNSAETVAQISQDAGDQVTSTTEVGGVKDTGGLMADLDEAEMKPVSCPFTEEQLSNFTQNSSGLKTANEIFTDFVNGNIKYNEMLQCIDTEIVKDSGIKNSNIIVPVRSIVEDYKNYTVNPDSKYRTNMIDEFNKKLLANNSIQLLKDKGNTNVAYARVISNTHD